MIRMKLELRVYLCSWVKVYDDLVSLGRGHCFSARKEKIPLRVHASQPLIPTIPIRPTIYPPCAGHMEEEV